MSSKIFHENLSFMVFFIILFFLFCLSNILSKFCFEELRTTSLDLKLFFIKLTEFGKIENTKIIAKLVNRVLKKFRLLLSCFFFKTFFFHQSL